MNTALDHSVQEHSVQEHSVQEHSVQEQTPQEQTPGAHNHELRAAGHLFERLRWLLPSARSFSWGMRVRSPIE